MDPKTSFLLIQLLHLGGLVASADPFQPTVQIVTGHSRVFSGDTVRLRCIPPASLFDDPWTYIWFHGPEQLMSGQQNLVLWEVKTNDTGKYSCQGTQHTDSHAIPTNFSVPIEINVDGGWAILDAPSRGVVGFPMNITCRVRGTPPVTEVVLYRDGQKVLRKEHSEFVLHIGALADRGEYTCVASWNWNRRTHSVISAPLFIDVVEPLSQPTLTIVDEEEWRSYSMLKLKCTLDYNVPAPAPPILYYFFFNDDRLGTPTTDNFSLVQWQRGVFKCKARVSQLGLSRWSEPESF